MKSDLMYKNKYSCYNLVVNLLFLGGFALLSCVGEAVSQPMNTPEPFVVIPTKTVVPTPEIDLVINLEDTHQSTIKVQEGQVFQIERPKLALEWQVDFDLNLLFDACVF